MKKITFALLAYLSIQSIDAQCLKKGTIIADFNVGTALSTLEGAKFAGASQLVHPNNNSFSIKNNQGFASFAKAEYMISNRWGLALDFSDNKYSYVVTSDSFNYDVKAVTNRIHLSTQYHWVVKRRWDLYSSLGVGYKNNRYEIVSNDSKLNELQDIVNKKGLSFKASLGTRYFITQGIGLNFEAGLGMPLITAGISLIPGKSMFKGIE